MVEAGEEGDALFVILDGAASVRRKDDRCRTVGPGAYFGELALLDGEPRSATVVSTEPITVAVLGVRMFRTLLREFPDMTAQVLAGLASGSSPRATSSRPRPGLPLVTHRTDNSVPMEERERLVAESAMFGSLVAEARAFVARTARAGEPPGVAPCSCARAMPATRCSSSRSAGSG